MLDEKCRCWIEEKAHHDGFLGTPDEGPVVLKLLDALQEKTPAAAAEVTGDLTVAREALLESFSQARSALTKSRDLLAQSFALLKREGPPDPGSVRQAIADLELQARQLYRPVCLNPVRQLEALSPETNLISSLLERTHGIYQAEMLKFPERSRLVLRPDDQGPFPPGKTIFEAESEAFLQSVCRSTLLPVNWMHFYWNRFLLKRRYRVVSVPLQESAQANLLSDRIIDEHRLREEHEQVHRQTLDELKRDWRAIHFNLETAATEFHEILHPPDKHRPAEDGKRMNELVDLALGVLERTHDNLEAIPGAYSDFLESLSRNIQLDHETAVEAIRQDVAQAGRLRVRVRWMHRHARSVLRRGERRLRDVVAQRRVETERLAKRAYFQIEDRILKAGLKLGITAKPKESLLLLADLPSPSKIVERAQTLPPVYRRLFSVEPLKDREFLVGRDTEIGALFEILHRWQSGLPCSVALVGPEGSGKSTLLNCFESEINAATPCARREIGERLRTPEDVLRLLESWFQLEQRHDSLSSLVKRLLTLPRQVVLVEGGHNLMLRTIGGQRSAEAFFYAMISTRGNFLWIMTVRRYPWDKMNYQLNISQYFTHEIKTLFRGEGELREALIRRQNSSGYRLSFSEEGVDDRKIRNLRLAHSLESEEVQKALEKTFFENLFKITGGNMLAAVFYWLLALSHDPAEERIVVSPCSRLDHQFLRSLDRAYLFTLAELLNHGGLTLKEHQTVFRTDLFRSRMILGYLCNIQLVRATGEDSPEDAQQYRVNPVFLHLVASTLESMNILY